MSTNHGWPVVLLSPDELRARYGPGEAVDSPASTATDVATLGEAGFESPESVAHDVILLFGYEGALDRMAHSIGNIRAVYAHVPITEEELEIARRVSPEDMEANIAFHEAIAVAIREIAGSTALPSPAALTARYQAKTPRQVAVELVFDHGRAGALARVGEIIDILTHVHTRAPESAVEEFIACTTGKERVPAEIARCEEIAAAIRGGSNRVPEEQGALGDPR